MLDQKTLDAFTPSSPAFLILKSIIDPGSGSPHVLELEGRRKYQPLLNPTPVDEFEHMMLAMTSPEAVLLVDDTPPMRMFTTSFGPSGKPVHSSGFAKSPGSAFFRGVDLLRVIVESFEPDTPQLLDYIFPDEATLKPVTAKPTAPKPTAPKSAKAFKPKSFADIKRVYEQGALHFVTSFDQTKTVARLAQLSKLSVTAWKKYPTDTAEYVKGDFPRWFTFMSDKPERKLKVKLTEDGAHAPGVFFLGLAGVADVEKVYGFKSLLNSGGTSKNVFNSALTLTFMKRYNLIPSSHLFAAFNASVVPVGLFDRTTAAFVPTTDASDARVVSKMFSEEVERLSPTSIYGYDPKGLSREVAVREASRNIKKVLKQQNKKQ